MSWLDRILEAAYTSPSGQRLPFQYEDVSLEFDKRGASYDFPDADGTYVQDLGKSGRRYPLTVYFSGSNYDLEAALFVAMLGEAGRGKLEHPMYGAVDVVPFGAITRRDNLKSGANQAIIEVTFWETTGLLYPTSQGDAAGDVLRAVAAYNQAVADQFAESVRLNTPSAKAGLFGDYSAALSTVKTTLAPIAAASADVQRQFTVISRSITEGLDTLIGDPLTLALQTAQLIQAPARAASSIDSRLDTYHALIAAITGTIETSGYGVRNSNRFKSNDQFVSGAASGQVLAVVNTQFVTKGGAVLAADTILAQLDEVTVWRDANYTALGELDTGAAYTALQSAIALAAGYLVEISFSLKQERRVTLDRSRTIIDLVAEFYGSVDDKLDFFISSNAFTGSEILEVPRGREVVYYV